MQIHNLNDFVGALGAGTFMALDNGEDTGKISLSDLFASNSATLLWSGSQSCRLNNEFTFNEPLTGFDYLDIYYEGKSNHHLRVPASASSITLQGVYPEDEALYIYESRLAIASDKLKVNYAYRWDWSGEETVPAHYNTGDISSGITITRIDGIATPANNKSIFKLRTATLAAADWTNGSQTVTVEDVTSTNSVLVCADPTSQTDFMTYGVNCIAQGADSLTFSCASTPASDLTVNIMVIG